MKVFFNPNHRNLFAIGALLIVSFCALFFLYFLNSSTLPNKENTQGYSEEILIGNVVSVGKEQYFDRQLGGGLTHFLNVKIQLPDESTIFLTIPHSQDELKADDSIFILKVVKNGTTQYSLFYSDKIKSHYNTGFDIQAIEPTTNE